MLRAVVKLSGSGKRNSTGVVKMNLNGGGEADTKFAEEELEPQSLLNDMGSCHVFGLS